LASLLLIEIPFAQTERSKITMCSNTKLVQEILQIYRRVDRAARCYQLASGLRCPPGCGVCCESHQVEATPLQCLPLAWAFFRRRQAEGLADGIESQGATVARRCVLRRLAEGAADKGRCTQYRLRPLVCRLFGFAARRNKYGKPEPALCKVVRQSRLETLKPLPSSPLDPATLPVYQDLHWQIAGLEPSLGYRLLPINSALAEALTYVYWRYPRRPQNHRQAA